MSDQKTILICTVGGSRQPILTALRARKWDRVVFVCSPGASGSVTMIEQAVGTSSPIPVLAGLDPSGWEVVTVPPDEPDAAFAVLVDKLRALPRDLPGADIVADFTGGTKSMSAALTLAALDAGVALQLVTGERADLVRVRDRTEQAIAVRTKRIAGAREFERLAAGWSRYAYQEAAEGFAQLWSDLKTEGLSREDLRPLTRAKELSQAFSAWDSFDHNGAFGCLRNNRYDGMTIGGRSDWRDLAAALVRERSASWTALHLRDLWRNAQRCAARGRYDDAVARLYRLWEGIAQWLLWADFQLDTAVVETGLKRSWDLYRHLRPGGEAASFWGREWTRLDEKLRIRNYSILAHGGDRVSRDGWNALSQWTETGLLDVLAREAERLGEAHELPQLPTTLPTL